MSKLLLFLLTLIGVMLLLRQLQKPAARKRGRGDEPNRISRGTRMVACKLCGLYVPEDEALRAGDEVYCCEDHRRRAG